jgi:hypothetical protein
LASVAKVSREPVIISAAKSLQEYLV